MDGLTLLIFFGLGYGLAWVQESPCPAPPPRAMPPAVLMVEPPTVYLLPENWQPAKPSDNDSSKTVQ